MSGTQTSVPSIWNARTLGLLTASTLAGFGAWIDFLVILAMAAYAYQANGFVMALVSALFLVPAMVLGPRLGRWLDRSDPGRAVLGGLALRIAATASLITEPSLPMFCLWVSLRAAFTVPVDPAFNIVVGRVVPREAVPRYFAIFGLMRNVSKITAPVIGTGVASYYGDAAALGLSITMTALALPIAATCVLGTRSPAPPQPLAGGAKAAAPEPMPDGSTALLSQFLVTVTVFAFVVFFVNNQLPVLLRDAGFDKALLGALVSCSGAGGILAAVYMAKSNAAALAKDPMTATTVSVFATSLCFVALGMAFLLPAGQAPIAAGLVFFCTGVFASIEAIRSNTVIVQSFGSNIGEVSGKVQSYTSAAMLGSPWAAAVVIPYLTLPALLVLDGLIGVLVLAFVFARYRSTASRRIGAVSNI